jgi:hypothetical protein
MTPGQCREARERLKWSHADLARAAKVPAEIVAMFESDELVGMMNCQTAMREALEAVGIGFAFLIERGQFVPAGVSYSPREPKDMN